MYFCPHFSYSYVIYMYTYIFYFVFLKLAQMGKLEMSVNQTLSTVQNGQSDFMHDLRRQMKDDLATFQQLQVQCLWIMC